MLGRMNNAQIFEAEESKKITSWGGVDNCLTALEGGRGGRGLIFCCSTYSTHSIINEHSLSSVCYFVHLSPGPVLLGGECCTTLVPPDRMCSLPWISKSNTVPTSRVSAASYNTNTHISNVWAPQGFNKLAGLHTTTITGGERVFHQIFGSLVQHVMKKWIQSDLFGKNEGAKKSKINKKGGQLDPKSRNKLI